MCFVIATQDMLAYPNIMMYSDDLYDNPVDQQYNWDAQLSLIE